MLSTKRTSFDFMCAPAPRERTPERLSGAELIERIKDLSALNEGANSDSIARGILANRLRKIYREILKYEKTR